MRSLGLDIGDKRTGVAISDPEGILATPLTVLAAEDEETSIDEIFKLVEEYKVDHIVIGLPRRLNGEVGKQASKVTAFADKLSQKIRRSGLSQVEVQLWDERLSTRAAERLKAETGVKRVRPCPGAKGRARAHGFPIKARVDAIAAALILQGFLDSRRDTAEF